MSRFDASREEFDKIGRDEDYPETPKLKRGDRVRPACDGETIMWTALCGTVTDIWQEGIDTRISVFWWNEEMGRQYGKNLPAYLVRKVSR